MPSASPLHPKGNRNQDAPLIAPTQQIAEGVEREVKNAVNADSNSANDPINDGDVATSSTTNTSDETSAQPRSFKHYLKPILPLVAFYCAAFPIVFALTKDPWSISHGFHSTFGISVIVLIMGVSIDVCLSVCYFTTCFLPAATQIKKNVLALVHPSRCCKKTVKAFAVLANVFAFALSLCLVCALILYATMYVISSVTESPQYSWIMQHGLDSAFTLALALLGGSVVVGIGLPFLLAVAVFAYYSIMFLVWHFFLSSVQRSRSQERSGR